MKLVNIIPSVLLITPAATVHAYISVVVLLPRQLQLHHLLQLAVKVGVHMELPIAVMAAGHPAVEHVREGFAVKIWGEQYPVLVIVEL